MNGTLRRLVFGGIGVLALWATCLGALPAGQQDSSAKPCTQPACSPDASAALKVTAGDCRNFNASGEVFKSHVEDPEVAEFVHYGPKEVGIKGLKPGTTTVTIWSEMTKIPVKLSVVVSEPAEEPTEEPAEEPAEEPTEGPELHQAVHDEVIQAAAAPLKLAAAVPGLPISVDTNYIQQVPAISIETSSPVLGNVGKIVEQQILVKNVGSVAAENVEVRGSVSIDSELITTEPRAEIKDSAMMWRIKSLPAGSQQKITVRVKPLVAGELSMNTNVSFKSSASMKVQVQAPKLKLVCDVPSVVLVGAEVRVAMTVANIGTATAEGVRVRQIVPAIAQAGGRNTGAPLVIDVGTLEPGESRVLETNSRATAAGIVQLKLVAETPDGVYAIAEHTLKVQAPKLEIATTGPDFRYLGRKATYQVVVSNSGEVTVSGLNVMVGLPEGLEFVDASHNAVYNSLKRTIAWAPGTLEGNRKLEYAVTVMPRTEGEHLQRAVAWAENNLVVKADKITRVEGITSLALEITDVDDPIEVGSETVHQIHITNKGSRTAQRVQVVAMVPEGLKVTGVEGPGTYRVQGQQMIFEPIASLAPQGTAVIQLRVKGIATGQHAIRAIMSCPAMTNSIVTEEATEVYGD